MAYMQMGRYREALEDVNRAIELDSANANYKISKMFIFLLAGQYEEAITESQ